jgi:hypothetical protein
LEFHVVQQSALTGMLVAHGQVAGVPFADVRIAETLPKE